MADASERKDVSMPQATDYLKRATECTDLAQTARSPSERTMLLHIAETWLRLASDAEDDESMNGIGETRPPGTWLM
jgi:hypothetical protein